jgi:chemotaxis protein MotB
MNVQYDKINELNDELIRKSEEIQKGKEAESAKLMKLLEDMKANLIKKEDELKTKENALKLSEKELQQKEENMARLNTELQKREVRVQELETMVKAQEEATLTLKNKISEALLGFKDKGLTIEQKNGKIYVSLEAKLLFATGSTKVDPDGKKALTELAIALEGQNDISILVEGHTDNDKMSGAGAIKDNWDLSVMRATSVVRILSENEKINPKQLTAAGRGEFSPITENTTPEEKAVNRRIEIILTPNLDNLFQILETE